MLLLIGSQPRINITLYYIVRDLASFLPLDTKWLFIISIVTESSIKIQNSIQSLIAAF